MHNVIGPFKGRWAFLSNFYRADMVQDGILFRSVEHYYQAYKATNRADALRVAQIWRPSDAKRAGRAIAMRPDWEQIKIQAMREGLQLKFKTYPQLAMKLKIETIGCELIEINTWGGGGTRFGASATG